MVSNSSSSSSKTIWIYHTKSELAVQKKVKDIIAKRIPEPERDFAVTVLRGGSSKVDSETEGISLVDQIMTIPLGCSIQLIVLYEYQKFMTTTALAKLINEIPSTTLLVCSSSEKLTPADKKRFQTYSQVDLVVEYFVRWEQVRSHLEQAIHRNKWKAGREVVEYLVKVFAENPQLMEKELEKLADYYTPHARITLESLNGLLAIEQNEQAAYTVINAFFSKEPQVTLRKFRYYLEHHGDLNMLVALLVQELLLIVKFKELKQQGLGLTQIFTHLGIHYDKPKQALQSKDAVFGENEIRNYLGHCWLIDKKLRQESLMSLEVDRPKVALNIKLELERLFIHPLTQT